MHASNCIFLFTTIVKLHSNTPRQFLVSQTKDFQSTLSVVTQPSFGAIYSPSGLGWIQPRPPGLG